MPSAERMIAIVDAASPAPHRRGRPPARRRGGPSRRSRRCSSCRSPTSCTARRRCTARTIAPNAVQLSTLLSIKTGGCPEDCGYCPQAKRYHTGVEDEALLDLDAVVAAARAAKAHGATRFCMGAAWRGPKQRDLEPVLAMVREVKALGLETCATLGMLKDGQAEQLKRRRPRLLQPQPRHGARVLRRDHHHARLPGPPRHARARARRRHQRLLRRHRRHGRVAARSAPALIAQLANLDPVSRIGADQPSRAGRGHAAARAASAARAALDPFEFVRTIAVARITMPKAMVRLSAGRRELGEAVQALCFLAGANSIFYGDKLLTTGNPDVDADRALFAKLGHRDRRVDARQARLAARVNEADRRARARPRRARGRRAAARAPHASSRRRARASTSTAAS